MQRAQVLLEPHQHAFLSSEARRLRISLSELVRRMVAERMGGSDPSKDALESLIGIAEGTGEPIGRDHDKHLYGDPRD
jgi:hypothetical protein